MIKEATKSKYRFFTITLGDPIYYGNLYKKINSKALPFNYYTHPFETFSSDQNKKFIKSQGLCGTFYGNHAGRHLNIFKTLIKDFKFDTLKQAYSNFI